MDEFEKRAWWNLGVAVGAVVAFATLWIVTRNPAGSMAAFAVLALSAAPFFRLRQPVSDVCLLDTACDRCGGHGLCTRLGHTRSGAGAGL